MSSGHGRSGAVIRCDGLSKRFGSMLAVDGLDLEVQSGQVYGFLGPNGAGKTTTIRMLMGLVAPSGGGAWVEGVQLPEPSVASMVGSMIEEPAFYPWMTGRANLELFGAVSRRAGKGAVANALRWVGAESFADRKVKTYSQGMRQRIGLADAVMGRPRLLILDEPTNGLDPAGIREFRGLLRSFAADGGTVFVSSHLLAEVEQVCDRAAVIVRGRLVEEGPVGTLGAVGRKVRVSVLAVDLVAAQDALARWLVAVEGTTLLVGHGSGRDVNSALVGVGVVAESIEVVKPSLEERFLSLTNGSAPASSSAESGDGGESVLLVAELRKLVRPLVWATGLAAIAFLLLLTLGASSNAASGMKSPRISSVCGGAASTLTPACSQQVAQATATGIRDAREEHRQEMPGAVGEVAVGMLASIPGVFLIALLAGAHVGGEWSGRSIRTVLTHDGRRLRVLAAKWVSLWLGTVVIVVAAWAVLAVAGPLLASAYGLPATGQGAFAGLGASLTLLGRALLVLGVFTLIGVAAGVFTRNTVGTIAVVVGAIGALVIVGAVQSVAKVSPATWVGAWMHFTFNGADLPTNFWTRFEAGESMSSAAGLVGLLGTLAVIGALTAWRAQADVTA